MSAIRNSLGAICMGLGVGYGLMTGIHASNYANTIRSQGRLERAIDHLNHYRDSNPASGLKLADSLVSGALNSSYRVRADIKEAQSLVEIPYTKELSIKIDQISEEIEDLKFEERTNARESGGRALQSGLFTIGLLIAGRGIKKREQ